MKESFTWHHSARDPRLFSTTLTWASVARRGLTCITLQVADPDKFKLLYKDLVIGSRTKDKGCVQYDLLQSTKDPVIFPRPRHYTSHYTRHPWFPTQAHSAPRFQSAITAAYRLRVQATYNSRRRVLFCPTPTTEAVQNDRIVGDTEGLKISSTCFLGT